MSEGSVFVDGFDGNSEETTSEDQSDDTSTSEESSEDQGSSDDQTDADKSESGESSDDGSDSGSSEPKLTDKGTKLDPNPQSAVHQELANERRVRLELEKVLTDPVKLREYMKESGYETPTQTQTETKTEPKVAPELQQVLDLMNPDKLQTVGDYAAALKASFEYNQKLVNDHQTKVEALTKELSGLSVDRRVEAVANSIDKDISLVREKYPELDPSKPEFSPELEKEIGELFNELDYDASAKMYRGQHSLASIAERFMRTAGALKKAGSLDAQKIIKEKRMGQSVPTGKATAERGEENLSPGQVIAQRIARMNSKR